MKIKISEDEFYSIGIPEEVSKAQFCGLMLRLEKINKLISKDVFENENDEKTVKPKPWQRTFKLSKEAKREARKIITNRTNLVRLYTAYYSGDKEKFVKVIADLGLQDYIKNRGYMGTGGTASLRRKLNIKPSEIGLKRFPTRGDGAHIPRIKSTAITKEKLTSKEKNKKLEWKRDYMRKYMKEYNKRKKGI